MSDSPHEKLAYRLSDMITMLNGGETLNIADLTEKYQVSRRTMLRDIEDRLGFLPLQKTTQGYKLEPSYLGQLSYKDIRTFAQISGISGLYPNLDTAFLREILDHRASQVYSVKGYTFEDAKQFEPMMSQLKSAIKSCRMVAFIYKDKSRLVAPYKIIHHRGCWYLAGVQDGELKAYRMSRISEFCFDDMPSFAMDKAIVDRINQDESIWYGQEKVEVVLKVSADVASHFVQRQLLPEQQLIKELDDGGLLLSSHVVSAKQILPLVRYWIPHIKIVSPEGWQNVLEEELKHYISFQKK
ncbi:WYL domain-containing protein [Moraxella sp. FZFQ2102]|uniref:helix-turn-helix transcriptional regulator n=1 Tax=Moraxella sp. FZFQ2102 TaxID=2953752 RepID=UPI00209C40D4|nr:WYL domain-containing protein [Moraxella sp. FZFQ2102]USZ14304.1 WYL domain-containing protein [Moraxella sp. FZFQ2102]